MVNQHKADHLNPLTQAQIGNMRKKAISRKLDKSLTWEDLSQRWAEIREGVTTTVDAIRA